MTSILPSLPHLPSARALACSALALVLGVAACGGDDGDPDDTTAAEDAGGDAAPTAERAVPQACWNPPGAECDPRTPVRSCGADRTCDLTTDATNATTLACLDRPVGAPEGGDCDPTLGDLCAPGLRCRDLRCVRFCCTDAECPQGQGCDALARGTGRLGTCAATSDVPPPDIDLPPDRPGPTCGRVGAMCQFDEQCCSRSCYLGYCT
jgi:hypothetical protein